MKHNYALCPVKPDSAVNVLAEIKTYFKPVHPQQMHLGMLESRSDE